MGQHTDPPLDADIARFVEQLRANATVTDNVGEMRQGALRARQALPWRELDAAEIEIPLESASMRALLKRPPSDPDAHNGNPCTLIYLHGGGWVLLSADTHASIAARLSEPSRCNVVTLDYPLAPEVRFPLTIDRCAEAIIALHERATEFGLGKRGLVLAGDSCGANLATAIALRLRSREDIPVKALVLAYGVFDSDLGRASYDQFSDAPYPLSRERMDFFWSQYCADGADRLNPMAAPLRADLTGLPPTLISIAGQDVLRDENHAMAEALAAAGVDVDVQHFDRASHAFWEAHGVSDYARNAVQSAADWLARQL